ncbi:alpha/beta hydrolase [Bacillus sp. FJAT-44742]|uniref:alpha/beta hydrolase n=1 Tax=Bacillus sp. FJAT-44742 TaxID=2014005 RepID=UPI000C233A4D|nr:alpha/beta fold hydrolase [Bacillus sp. FJAT-44742]
MIGCLCLHGFTGAPWEVEPVVKKLKKNKDWLIYSPTLPGHGPGDDLKGATYKAWIYAADKACAELFKYCEKVYVIGFSMGGMLACYLSARYPVEKVVLLGAAAYYVNPPQLLKDFKIAAEARLKGTFNKEDPWYQFYSKKIQETPLTAVYEFTKAVKTVRPFVKEITIPSLIMQGELDGLVPVKSAEYLFENMGSREKRLYLYKDSRHYLCHGPDKKRVLDDLERFLKNENKPRIQGGNET